MAIMCVVDEVVNPGKAHPQCVVVIKSKEKKAPRVCVSERSGSCIQGIIDSKNSWYVQGIIDSRESRFVDDRINLQKDGMRYLSSGKLLLRCKLATRWWHQPKKRNLKPLKGSYPEETERGKSRSSGKN
jgi:hypothetical protein